MEDGVRSGGRLREDFDLYAERARITPDSNEANRWHLMAKRAQEIIVGQAAIDQDMEPGEIAELMALMSGNPVEVLRRLLVTFSAEVIDQAWSEVRGDGSHVG